MEEKISEYDAFRKATNSEDSEETRRLFDEDTRQKLISFQARDLVKFTNRPAPEGRSIAEELRKREDRELHELLDNVGVVRLEKEEKQEKEEKKERQKGKEEGKEKEKEKKTGKEKEKGKEKKGKKKGKEKEKGKEKKGKKKEKEKEKEKEREEGDIEREWNGGTGFFRMHESKRYAPKVRAKRESQKQEIVRLRVVLEVAHPSADRTFYLEGVDSYHPLHAEQPRTNLLSFLSLALDHHVLILKQLRGLVSEPEEKQYLHRVVEDICRMSIKGEEWEDAWKHIQRGMKQLLGAKVYVQELTATRIQELGITLSVASSEGRKCALFLRRGGNTAVDIARASGGEIEMLQVLYALYSPFVHSVLLDEPGAHLHPSTRSQLYDHITHKHRGKVVVTVTHNSELISEKTWNALYHFGISHSVGKVIRPQRLPPLGLLRTPEMLPTLFAQGLILMEGPDDVRFMKAVDAALQGGHLIAFRALLKRVPWHIWGVGGKLSMINAISFLRHLDVPYIAVVDYDAIQGKSEQLFKFLNLPEDANKERLRNCAKKQGVFAWHNELEHIFIRGGVIEPLKRDLFLRPHLQELVAALAVIEREPAERVSIIPSLLPQISWSYNEENVIDDGMETDADSYESEVTESDDTESEDLPIFADQDEHPARTNVYTAQKPCPPTRRRRSARQSRTIGRASSGKIL